MMPSLPFRWALTAACILASLSNRAIADRGYNDFQGGGHGHHEGGHGWDYGGDHGHDRGGDYGEHFNRTALRNISCTNDTCPLDWGGQGVFVCRTRYNEYTGASSQGVDCIMSNHSFANDTCGCCGGTCPTPCTKCACTLPVERDREDFFSSATMAPRAGVYVLISGHTSPICVPQSASMMMVYNSNGRVTCYTSC